MILHYPALSFIITDRVMERCGDVVVGWCGGGVVVSPVDRRYRDSPLLRVRGTSDRRVNDESGCIVLSGEGTREGGWRRESERGREG